MPIFDGFGGYFFTTFIIRLIALIDKYMLTGIGAFLTIYSYTISIIFFIIILLFGYLSIFEREKRKSEIKEEREYKRGRHRRIHRR